MEAGASSKISTMMAGLRKAMRAYPDVSRMALDQPENDLHVELLSRCPNPELLQSLQRTRCKLTLSKHVLGESAPMPKRDPFMAENLAVLGVVSEGDRGRAEDALRSHLEASCKKVARRVELVRDTSPTPKLPYMNR